MYKKIQEWIYKKTGRSLTWSYYIIIILAIATNFVGYFGSACVVEDELKNSGMRSVTYAKNICDSYFASTFSNAYGILQSNSMKYLLMETDERSYIRSEHWKNVSKNIMNMSGDNRIVQNVYVFTKDFGISQADIGETKLMYHAYFRNVYSSFEEFEEEIFSAPPQSFRQKISPAGIESMYAFYTLSTLKGRCVVVIELAPEIIDTMFDGEKNHSDEKFFIVNSHGKILFAPASERYDELKLFSGNNSNIQSERGERRVIAHIASDYSDLLYVRTIPVNIYLRSIRTVQITFVIGYLLCLLLVIPLARLFARITEFHRQSMRKKLEKQNTHMRSELLAKLLTEKTEEVNSELFQECGLSLNGKWFAAILMEGSIRNYSQTESVKFPDDTEFMSLMAVEFMRISSGMQVYFCKISNVYAGVVSVDDMPNIASIQNYVESLCDLVLESYGIEFVCAVSRLVKSPEMLYNAWEQAREIIGFRFLGDERTVYMYDDVLSEESQFIMTPEDERELSEALISGDASAAETLIENLFNNKGKIAEITLNMLNVLVFEIINTIIKTAIQTNNKAWIDYKELYLLPIEINSMKEISSVRDKITLYVEQLCQRSRANFKNSESNKYEKVIEYIENNYTDTEMHVNQLADIFQMNRSFFSRDFKEKVGVAVADYIIKYRIEKAIQLLNTDKTITQIANETGFSSAAVFRNAFKKVENVTPGQYRQRRML